MTAPDPQQPHNINIIMPPDMMGGVWANFAGVSHSLHEFTLDFMRMDYAPSGNPVQGVVVARVNMSPLFVAQLLEALNTQWQTYVSQSMPSEVRGDDKDS